MKSIRRVIWLGVVLGLGVSMGACQRGREGAGVGASSGAVSGVAAGTPVQAWEWRYLGDAEIERFAAVLPEPPGSPREPASDFETRIDWLASKWASPAVVAGAKAVDAQDHLEDFAFAMGPGFGPGCKAVYAYVNGGTADGRNIVAALKERFHRPRPTLPAEGTQELGFSYPSGHATRAGVRSRLLAALEPGNERLELQLMKEATLMCMNRVVLSRHYPSDITAGLFLGQAIAQRILDQAAADPKSAAGEALRAAREEWAAMKAKGGAAGAAAK